MNKMREEFEAWANGYNVYRSEIGGYYVDSYVNVMWQSWKASRAAICVELPDSWIAGELGDDANVISAVDIMESLEEAGVSYK